MLSVICPIYNEEKYIAECIESIIAQDFPKENLEVLFVDGMSSDRTREIVTGYSARYPWIHMLDNPDRIVPPALNLAIKASKGDIVMRLDAHAKYPKNYFSVLCKSLETYNADNVGAMCKTDVINHTPKSDAIKKVLSHPLGVGNSTFRTGVDRILEVDTVPFGCWKKECFKNFGLFDERLIRNQDIEFNKRIKSNGGKILITPDTYSIYYARESFSALARNNYENGRWNILTVWYTHQFRSLSLRHFIPLVFILSLFLPLILSIFFPIVAWGSLIILILYVMVISMVSLHLAIQSHQNWFYLVITFIVLHISYGIGSLMGILSLPFISPNKQK